MSALENTDLQPVWLRGVEVTDEEVSEHQVRFDAGTVRVSVLNNGEGWDALVKLLDGDDVVAQTRTYGGAKEMQVPPGVYTARIQALAVEGAETTFDVGEIEVAAGQLTEVEHPFASGVARIGVSIGEELVDATLKVTETSTGTGVASARTYAKADTNPRDIVLTPGTYTVRYAALGAHRGHAGSVEITVEPGETVEHVVQLGSE